MTDAQFIANGKPLSYIIQFENKPSATAPAQVVVITDQLDGSKVDFDTFSLGSVSFGNITVPTSPGVTHYTGGVDLRPDQNIQVLIEAGLDKSTGIVTWLFTSIDPDTGQLTEDPDAGFLPPNVNPPEGDGNVAFTVEPKSGLASGTTICNQASIVFDVNAPIETPQWCNTIDEANLGDAATTTVTSSANPSVFGQAVSFTATVMSSPPGLGVPGGTVQFKVDGSSFGAAVTLAGGTATWGSTSSLAVGPHTIDAIYSGDLSFLESTGTLTQTVGKASTTTAVTSSANPSVFGQGVCFTASVAAVAPGSGVPGGTVQFKVDGSNFGAPVTLAGGVATSGATSSLAVGSHTVDAVYSGSASFDASTGSLTQAVSKASTTTTVTSSANPVGLLDQVTFTATVSPVAPGGGTRTGTVQFKKGTANLGGPVALNASGQASRTRSGLALGLGTHQITAVYSGDGNFNGSVSPVLNQKVVLICLLGICI